jgi:hypothetical protein
MSDSRHGFDQTERMPPVRESTSPGPGPAIFLPKEELRLPRSTAMIVGGVILVPLLLILVWLVLGITATPGRVTGDF